MSVRARQQLFLSLAAVTPWFAGSRGVHDLRGPVCREGEEGAVKQEPVPGRRRIMLNRVAMAAQVASIALAIVRIVREWILPNV